MTECVITERTDRLTLLDYLVGTKVAPNESYKEGEKSMRMEIFRGGNEWTLWVFGKKYLFATYTQLTRFLLSLLDDERNQID